MNTQRRLTPEEKAILLEALKIGVEKGYGYHRVWKMLKRNMVEVSRSIVRSWYYRIFPERVRRRGECLPR
jgi:hypothetical protein